jgi:hypothetical protein
VIPVLPEQQVQIQQFLVQPVQPVLLVQPVQPAILDLRAQLARKDLKDYKEFRVQLVLQEM